jgi:NADPH:quinone reductase-like Zn-dependent oxidoreductase
MAKAGSLPFALAWLSPASPSPRRHIGAIVTEIPGMSGVTGTSHKEAVMTEMQAIRIHEFGGPNVLLHENVERPQPGADEVLVKVIAASVNPVDYKTREGRFPVVKEEDLPITLGRDLSGIVEACGSQAGHIRKGDAVFALLGRDRGSHAQYALVRLTELAPKPGNLSHAEAASVPLAALTAWQGLIDHGGLRRGQRVLIHGAAGGVGHFAVQIAKAKGAWVAATCSEADMDFVHELGADQVIDYKHRKFEEAVKDIDLVLDLIGGETQDRSFAVLKQGGAMISTFQEPNQNKARQGKLRAAHYMTDADYGELAEIAGLLLLGKIRPHIAATFPLGDVASAETLLDKGHVRGKVVLTISPEAVH